MNWKRTAELADGAIANIDQNFIEPCREIQKYAAVIQIAPQIVSAEDAKLLAPAYLRVADVLERAAKQASDTAAVMRRTADKLTRAPRKDVRDGAPG